MVLFGNTFYFVTRRKNNCFFFKKVIIVKKVLFSLLLISHITLTIASNTSIESNELFQGQLKPQNPPVFSYKTYQSKAFSWTDNKSSEKNSERHERSTVQQLKRPTTTKYDAVTLPKIEFNERLIENPPLVGSNINVTNSKQQGRKQKNRNVQREHLRHSHKSHKNGLRFLNSLKGTSQNVGLFPTLFNVATRAKISVNATCGQSGWEEYCKLLDAYPHKRLPSQCGVCNDYSSDITKRRPIESVISTNAGLENSWWQSPALHYGQHFEHITITLDLRQVYQVFFIMLKSANSPRPASWILERSIDGVKFSPWQFFGLNDADCRRRYGLPGQSGKFVFQKNTEVICTTQFSKVLPLENGETHVSLLKNRPGAAEQSDDLIDFITARFVRIRFQAMHSTSNLDSNIDWLLDARSLKKRSFYSLKQIRLSARLDCNGHADRTVEQADKPSRNIAELNVAADSYLQCICQHNTCGVNCQDCCPLYHNKLFKRGSTQNSNECQKCQCNGHSENCIYDSYLERGICQGCRNNTAGNECQFCESGFFKLIDSASEPCIPCNCSMSGSDGRCQTIGGKCQCLEGFEGHRCEKCSPGFFTAECKKCQCDPRGSINPGKCSVLCQCKENVGGDKCSECQPGFFDLKKTSTHGCTPCWCSDVGLMCTSAQVEEKDFETLQNWEIRNFVGSRSSIPTLDSEANSLVYSMYDLDEEKEVLFWNAPQGYVGNRLTSYGSQLSIKISWTAIRGDTSGRSTSGPYVILWGKNGFKIAYGRDEFYSHSTSAAINITLDESGWYLIPDSETGTFKELGRKDKQHPPVTRNNFLSILASLEHLLIRATYHTDQVETTLENAVIYSGEDASTGSPTSRVEQCVCPAGYIGLSCETCDFGFIRVYEPHNNTNYGKCIPCPCNGHSKSCDLQTGICGNCSHNTYGERCERCMVGFYGNPLQGTPFDCKRCACPLSSVTNNFSPSCQLKSFKFSEEGLAVGDVKNSEYICTQCPVGYTGDHCEKCDDNYFGDPKTEGSKCQPCLCASGSCDAITGKCNSCKGNTEGLHCERCKKGYWGDPSIGCEPCDCNQDGAGSGACNSTDGKCLCMPRFSGHKCHHCDVGFFNVGHKCLPCDCDVFGSSNSNFCDPQNGQCQCKFGVEGLKCNVCADKHFGLKEDSNGCQECLCSAKGAISANCDKNTGQCLCLPNVVGRRCKKCKMGHWNLTEGVGCVDCLCDPVGSKNRECNLRTGQCVCKVGVGGQRCNECSDGFFGFSNDGCRRCFGCFGEGKICDLSSGRCVCPSNSRGPGCSQCLPGFWGSHLRYGCRECDCDYKGSIQNTCDSSTGQCQCREGFSGLQCNSCAPGYFGYPECRRCNCDPNGTFVKRNELVSCDSNGQCPCKALVVGLKCDACVQSSFGLSAQNPEGCTRCFCFGRSTECEQSNWSWGHIRMPETRILEVEFIRPQNETQKGYVYIASIEREGSNVFPENSEVNSINNLSLIPQSTGNISISAYGFAISCPLYFQLPSRFYGDRTSSYGGNLYFTIITEGAQKPLEFYVLAGFPLVQLHAHSKLVLDYFEHRKYEYLVNTTYKVPLHESYWKHHFNGRVVDRATIMLALQNVRHIFLRGFVFAHFTKVLLQNVHMDTAININGSLSAMAIGVENCNCPKRYDGLSCQNPGNGFYRWRNLTETEAVNIEDLVGRAVPCQCNGRSNKCVRETSVCQQCSQNTGGDHCERCAEGFFGDPNSSKGCLPCPCPEISRNFAKGCTVLKDEVHCVCQKGYSGKLCDSCEPGYFKSEDHNKKGSCKPCRCNTEGSKTPNCDDITGQCKCHDGIYGLKCDNCLAERYYLKDFHCQICDNCSSILLDRTERIKNKLRKDFQNVDLQKRPPPFFKVEEYEVAFKTSNEHFHHFTNVIKLLNNYDSAEVLKLYSNAENIMSLWRKIISAFSKKQNAAVVLKNAFVLKATLTQERQDIERTIFGLYNYENSEHHVNLPIVVQQALSYLKSIREHNDLIQILREISFCAWGNMYRFGNASNESYTQQGNVDLFLTDLYQLNYRISDMRLISEKAIAIQVETDDYLEHIHNIKAHVLNSYSKIYELTHYVNQNINSDLPTEIQKVKNERSQKQNIMVDIIRSFQHHSSVLNSTLIKKEILHREVKKHWLPKVQRHLDQLQERSNDYQRKFQQTKNTRIAVLASLVYKNISDAIDVAQSNVAEAKASVRKAEDALYSSNNEKSVIQRAEESLIYSKVLGGDKLHELQDIRALKEKLKLHEAKVEKVRLIIYNAGVRANHILTKLQTEVTTVNSSKLIQESQVIAKHLSEKMRSETKTVINLYGYIQNLRDMVSVLYPEWEIDKGMAEENISLTKTNVRLANITLLHMEQKYQKDQLNFDEWNQTIYTHLQDLFVKVTLARHAAEGIQVSLQSPSIPKCIRSYFPSHCGLCTSNSLQLSLAISDQHGDGPILYMQGIHQHFIYLDIIKRHIRLTWYLGGSTGRITHPLEIETCDPKYDEAWYHVEANRTLNIGTLLVRRMNNYGKLLPSVTESGESNYENTRFSQGNSDRIYLGGYPPYAQQNESETNMGLNAVIHRLEIDNQLIGMWNFQKSEGKCSGAIAGVQESSSISVSRYFNGFGYAKIEKPRRRPYRKNMFSLQMTFKTLDENALIFLALDNKNNRSISVTLKEGRIMFHLEYRDDIQLVLNTTIRYNTGRWIQIEAAREFVPKRGTESVILRVDNDRLFTGSPSVPINSQHLPDLSEPIFYLGGVPPGFKCTTSKALGAYSPLLGCMRDVQINGETYDPIESSTLYGVEPYCKEVITRAEFNGKGYIELQAQSLRKNSNVAFVFRTLQVNCLILLSAYSSEAAKDYDSKDIRGNYSVSLINGYINVWINSGRELIKMNSLVALNDGELHAFNLIKSGRHFKLFVDDELQDTKNLTISPTVVSLPREGGGLYIGGAPSFMEYTSLAATSTRLEGTIQDVILHFRKIYLNQALSLNNVKIGRLGPSMQIAENTLNLLHKTESLIGKRFAATKKGCLRMGSYHYEPSAFKFGDKPYSHSLLKLSKRNFWRRNFIIDFDIRTFYQNGLILYSPGSKAKSQHYVALVLKDGQLIFIVRGRRREELKLTVKLNDGEWHHVSLNNNERIITISVIVGQTNRKASAQTKLAKRIYFSNMIYVGGMSTSIPGKVPVDLFIKLGPFKGCMRYFQINNITQDLARPNTHSYVGQCFSVVQRGSYFPGDAYAIYNRQFHVGNYFELQMEFRTSDLTGVLVSVSEPSGFPALSLELHDGNIIFACDVGNGIPIRISSKVPLKHVLCDNRWHNAYAFYDFEQISVHVDGFPATMRITNEGLEGNIRTKSPLYIGGLPDISSSGSLLSRENFKGCMRNVVIRNESREWIDMDSLHNVLLGECLISDFDS